MPIDSKARVFVMHSAKDKPFARKLVRALKEHNLYVWIDELELQVGGSIRARFSEGFNNTVCLVAVLSKAALASRWLQAELLNATLIEELPSKGVAVLPVLIEDCGELPIWFRDRVYADFRSDFEVGLQTLLGYFENKGEFTADAMPKAASEALPSKDTLADLGRLICERMGRREVAEIWFAVLLPRTSSLRFVHRDPVLFWDHLNSFASISPPQRA